MSEDKLTRRKLVRNGVAAAGMAVGLGCSQRGEQDPSAVRNLPEPGADVLNRNENMEYRRLGKTGLMVSAISLGGHWKHLPYKSDSKEFKQNRHDVISACIDCGINLVDACTASEIPAYGEALRGRRDRMYFCYSWYEHEMRYEPWQSTSRLMQSLDEGLAAAGHDYVDIWRITCFEPGSKHTRAHEEMTIEALEQAKKAGKARFVGISSHDRAWLDKMVRSYPQLEMVLTPYTAGSNKRPTDSLFDTLKQRDVGMLGIKPFASGSVFRSRGALNPATQNIDDERARLALRHVLANDALTAAIPGMISVDQVKNAAASVLERRAFDVAETHRLDRAVKEMWAQLPKDYEWLRQWEWV